MTDHGTGDPQPGAGYVPIRANLVRDVTAAVLLVVALFLPWSVYFGFGIPGTNSTVYAVLVALTLLAVLGALAVHVPPLRLTAQGADVRRASRVRFWLSVAYFLGVVGFVVFHIEQIVLYSGTGAVPPGIGPGAWLGAAGAVLAAQPPITATTLEDNSFQRWYSASRIIGITSIALAAVAVAYNLFLRLRYLFVTDIAFGAHDAAVVVTTLLYGAVAMTAVAIGSSWLVQKSAAGRLAATALGASTVLAGLLVWVAGVGRDVDAFHGIAQNTSTAAVGYEGFLAWAAAAAIVAPTTLYAVFLIRPPNLGVYRGAALKCLSLIAFWAFAAAGLRVVDFFVTSTLELPHSIYDTIALAGFNLTTGVIAVWLRRNLAKGGLSSTVIAAFSGVLAVFTIAQLVLGVALAPRYDEPSPTGVYGNNLAQQITSTFDVVICGLSVAILVAVLLTGPLAGWVVKRRAARPVAKAPAAKAPVAEAPVPVGAGAPVAPPAAPAAPTGMLRIHRRPDPARADTAEPTAMLRIQRRPETTGAQPLSPDPGDGPTPPTAQLRIQRRPEQGPIKPGETRYHR